MADEFPNEKAAAASNERALPQPPESAPDHQLPWPPESDPAVLGREWSEPHRGDDRRLADSFADPNSADDRRLGRGFEELESSAKKHGKPLKEVVHIPANRKPFWIGLAVFAFLFLIVVIAGLLPRHNRDKQTRERADQAKNAKPVVDVQTVRASQSTAGLVVPGTTIPLTEAFVYARANGYLKKRLADIGDHVRKNQLLAIIDAPDLDQQVDQAREQVSQAGQQLAQQRSQLALATVTVQRYRVLVAKGVFSRQEGDQQEANYASALANVAAAERNVEAYRANLRRVQALQSYEYVRAPFAGVITQRNVDVGALISAQGSTSGAISGPAPQGQTSSSGGSQQAAQSNNAGSSGNTGSAATPTQSPGQGGPLFGVAQTGRLRVLVSVPEGYATSIHPGEHAQLSFQEYSGKPVTGEITRTSASVDANTRTMLTEIQVDNRAGRLIPGMYTVATFPPAASNSGGGPLLIVGEAIAIRQDRPMVAVVSNGRVHFVPVIIGRDFGDQVEISNGLHAGEQIVVNVTDDVVEGAEVQAQESKQQKETAPAPEGNRPPGGSTRYGSPTLTDQNLQGKQAQQGANKPKGKQGVEQEKKTESESKP